MEDFDEDKMQKMQQLKEILEDMVSSLLVGKPEDPIPHMIQFLQDKN